MAVKGKDIVIASGILVVAIAIQKYFDAKALEKYSKPAPSKKG